MAKPKILTPGAPNESKSLVNHQSREAISRDATVIAVADPVTPPTAVDEDVEDAAERTAPQVPADVETAEQTEERVRNKPGPKPKNNPGLNAANWFDGPGGRDLVKRGYSTRAMVRMALHATGTIKTNPQISDFLKTHADLLKAGDVKGILLKI